MQNRTAGCGLALRRQEEDGLTSLHGRRVTVSDAAGLRRLARDGQEDDEARG